MSFISFTLMAVLVASAAAISLLPNIMIGTCVESCSPNFIIRASKRLSACPAGYACMSNGCGHTCEPVFSLDKKAAIMCPMIGCANDCIRGYLLGANGCPTCICL